MVQIRGGFRETGGRAISVLFRPGNIAMNHLTTATASSPNIADSELSSLNTGDAGLPGSLVRAAHVAALLVAAAALLWLGAATVEWARDLVAWVSESATGLLDVLRSARWAYR